MFERIHFSALYLIAFYLLFSLACNTYTPPISKILATDMDSIPSQNDGITDVTVNEKSIDEGESQNPITIAEDHNEGSVQVTRSRILADYSNDELTAELERRKVSFHFDQPDESVNQPVSTADSVSCVPQIVEVTEVTEVVEVIEVIEVIELTSEVSKPANIKSIATSSLISELIERGALPEQPTPSLPLRVQLDEAFDQDEIIITVYYPTHDIASTFYVDRVFASDPPDDTGFLLDFFGINGPVQVPVLEFNFSSGGILPPSVHFTIPKRSEFTYALIQANFAGIKYAQTLIVSIEED